jgi:hypothetical protein
LESRGGAVLVACLLLSGCASKPVVEVSNTSGYVQQVLLTSGEDVYWVDSIGVGQSRCWRVPDHARGQHATLWVSIPRDAQRAAGLPWAQSWVDSLVLSRGWLIQVHAPRLVEGTVAWNDRRRQSEAEVGLWFDRAAAKALVPPDQLLKLRADMLDDSSLRSPDARHLAPSITKSEQRNCAS